MGKHDSKTEKPTPQRRRKARREGQVARSQEVGVAASLLAAALAARLFWPSGFETLVDETRFLIGSTTGEELPAGRIGEAFGRIVLGVFAPVAGLSVVAGLAAGVGQVGFKPSWKAAQPKLSKLSPKRGAEKLKPSKASWELVRAVVKLGLLFLLILGPMRDWAERMGRGRSLDAGLSEALGQAWVLLLRGLLLAAVIAVADYAWQRWRHEKQLKMSHHEVKRDHKEAEGDPQIRQARRRRAQELSRNRMLQEVTTADVVVTNPTHIAVALRYGADDPAPRVVAKGTDRIAARIRQIAHRHGVTVTEDKPLARSLYRRCKLDGYVPAALYEAVAVVLALAYRRSGKAPATAGAR